MPAANPMLPVPELRIPRGQTLRLSPGWSYGDLIEPDQRELHHDSGITLLVTEAELEDTADWFVFQKILELALRRKGT